MEGRILIKCDCGFELVGRTDEPNRGDLEEWKYCPYCGIKFGLKFPLKINYNCTLLEMTRQIGIQLWQAMEMNKYNDRNLG